MEFLLLGPLKVRKASSELFVGGGRQRALLAALLIRPNEVVSADRLIDELWGSSPPANPENALQALVSRLRRSLGDRRVEHRAGGYLLRVEPGERDVDQFLDLRQRGDLRGALALWRGPPLADVEFDDFAQPEIARLEELRLTTIEELVDTELARGRHRDVVAELERLVAVHPLREHLRAQLLVALYRSGRQADALSSYRDARRALVEELGLEPGDELRDLEQAILRHDPALRAMSRSHRRPLRLVAVGAAVAAAAGVLLAGSTETAAARISARDVAVLDASTGGTVASISLGFEPTAHALGAGGLWIGGSNGQVVRVDPGRLRVSGRWAFGRSPVKGLAAGGRNVWFVELTTRRSIIYRLDMRTGAIERGFQIADRTSLNRRAPEPLSLARTALWASNGLTTLTRIDLTTGRALRVVPDDGSGELWASRDTVWSLSAQTDSLTRIDPRTMRSVNVIPLAQNLTTAPAVLFPIALRVGYGSVWIVEYRGQSLGRVDERTNAVVTQIELGHPVVSVAVGARAVWAASSDGTLQRIDPRSNRVVETLHVAGSPNGLALARGLLFVTVS